MLDSILIAYLGPGSGLAISFSLFTIVLLAVGVVFVIVGVPLSIVTRLFRRRRLRGRTRYRKVIILGLDGLDPRLVRELMSRGRLPNFAKLAREGYFSELQTVLPAITPAAWSSFATGNDPSRHNIFDFVTRDPATYLPKLSSAEVTETPDARLLGIRLPWRQGARARMLRKGVPFWHAVAESGAEVSVLRVPITFPPEPFAGRLLSGMCVPDLLGSQGTFSCYSSAPRPPSSAYRSGEHHELRFIDGSAKSSMLGPMDAKRRTRLDVPLEIQRRRSKNGEAAIALRSRGWRVELKPGEFSRRLPVEFGHVTAKVSATVQFHLATAEPDVKLYMSPVQICPRRPAMKIVHPKFFSQYLATRDGSFGTLGLLEDTEAFDEGVLDERAFLEQAWGNFEERRRMFLGTLEKNVDDLTICVFDTPDRIQHMFWREHEAAAVTGGAGRPLSVIEEMIVRMDDLVGQTLRHVDDNTLLLVISDHGFTAFRRGVHLNAWLHRRGYLHLLPDASFDRDWLEGVDWSRTRAFALGLTGIYANVTRREKHGIVQPGEELHALVRRIACELEELRDDAVEGSPKPIRRAYVTSSHFDGPYRFEGPDLLIGYEHGYRVSWESARGQVGGPQEPLISDNARRWSGDHIVDPLLVPGVMLSNHRFARTQQAARIVDIAATVLDVFGVAPNTPMQGVSLFRGSISEEKGRQR